MSLNFVLVQVARARLISYRNRHLRRCLYYRAMRCLLRNARLYVVDMTIPRSGLDFHLSTLPVK